MRHGRYPASPEGFVEWIEDMKSLVRGDDDNLIVFAGETGAGKTTAALQVMTLLDEGFGLDRIVFGVSPFMEKAPDVPKFGSLLGDEFLANRRKAMRGEMIELQDFFQYCRAFNLQMGICFPNEERMDLPIIEDRAKWMVEVVKHDGGARVMIVSKKVKRKMWLKGGRKKTIAIFVEVGRWKFGQNEGEFWDAYLARKEAFMRSRGVDVKAQPGQVEGEFSSFEWFLPLRESFARLRREDSKASSARASVEKAP